MQPSVFVKMMINRLLNDGVTNVYGQDLILILENVKESTNISEVLRETAAEFYKYQTSK